MSEAIELAIVLAAKDLASEHLQKVGEHLHGLGGAAKLAEVGIAAVAAAGLAVGAALVGMAEGAAHTAGEVRKLARETGLSAEEASKWTFVGERFGVEAASMSKALGIFSKALDADKAVLAEHNIEIIKNADGQIDMSKTLDEVAEKFKEMPDGVEKTALALNLFGRSGKDMIPVLNKGSEGIKELGDEAAKMGLVFSKQGLESAKQFGLAQKDLHERIEGFKNTLGMAFLPVLTNVFRALSDGAAVVLPLLIDGFKKIEPVVGTIIGVFGTLKTLFSAVGEIVDVLTGKNKSAGGEMRALIGDAAEPLMSAIGELREAWAALSTALLPIVTGIRQFVTDHFTEISAVIRFTFDVIKAVIQTAWDVISGIFHIALALIQGDWSGAWDAMVTMLRNVFGDIGAIFRSLAGFGALLAGIALDLGRNIVTGIVNGLGSLKDSVFSAIGGAIRDAINSIDFWVGPFHVTGAGVTFQMPSFGGSSAPPPTSGGYFGESGYTAYGGAQAAGGDYMVTKPTLFLAGEAGPERATFSPAGSGRGAGGGVTVNVNISGDVVGLSKTELASQIGSILYDRMALAGRLA